MLKPNYFDVLKLKDTAKAMDIDKAIEDYDNAFKVSIGLGAITQQEKANHEIEMQKMREWRNDLNAVRTHREDFVENQKKLIRRLISMLPNNYDITRGELNQMEAFYRIDVKIIKELLVENPNHTINVLVLGKLPEGFLPVNTRGIDAAIARFSTDRLVCATWPWAKDIKNLYQFVGALEGMNEASARNLSTPVLASILQNHQQSLAFRLTNIDSARIARDMLGSAQIVFNTAKPENRQAYDNYLMYQSLAPLFEEIQTIPHSMRKEEHIFNHYIEKIKEVFPDQRIAFAIYCREAKIL